MLLYYTQLLRKTRLSERELFETAYIWKYGKMIDVSQELLRFRATSQLPVYMTDFIHHMQSGETPCK